MHCPWYAAWRLHNEHSYPGATYEVIRRAERRVVHRRAGRSAEEARRAPGEREQDRRAERHGDARVLPPQNQNTTEQLRTHGHFPACAR